MLPPYPLEGLPLTTCRMVTNNYIISSRKKWKIVFVYWDFQHLQMQIQLWFIRLVEIITGTQFFITRPLRFNSMKTKLETHLEFFIAIGWCFRIWSILDIQIIMPIENEIGPTIDTRQHRRVNTIFSSKSGIQICWQHIGYDKKKIVP